MNHWRTRTNETKKRKWGQKDKKTGRKNKKIQISTA
jgi:hypothetical protein